MIHSLPGQELTAQQEAALSPGIRLIEAGPGAGKTQTVVARLRRRASSGKRVALLSFTNAAVDVARSRCRDAPDLLEPPNFIGTFDQFFHRYVLTPATRKAIRKSPTYLSSWDDLPAPLSVVRPSGGGTGVRLSAFMRQTDGSWSVEEAGLTRSERLAWEKLSDWGKTQLNRTGSTRIDGLHGAQVYDTAEARERALAVLSDPASTCLSRLSLRFQELIVDEFQDCDRTEYQLLSKLKHAGIHIVVVADPDQAIYEFRQGTSDLYEQFRGRLREDEIANLTTCFRSSPVICSIVTSLRSVGSSAIAPHPDHVGGSDQVHLVIGGGVKAGTTALRIAREQGIGGGKTRVIAHRRADARALVRAGQQAPRGTSQMEGLLSALADLHSGTDARGRLAATRKIEGLILDQFAWGTSSPASDSAPPSDSGSGRLARKDQLAALRIEPEDLRVTVAKLLKDSRSWSDARACTSRVRETYESFAASLPIGLMPNLGRRLVIPPKVWTFWLSRTDGLLVSGQVDGVRWGHVHGVKGEEFDAVVLALPARTTGSSHVLDDWEHNQNTEQRRVLYVAASRARRLLVVVVPKTRQAQIETILTDAAIPFATTSAL